MKRALISIYIDPEFYPPTRNAIFCLADKIDQVIVITRNNFAQRPELYPPNVKFIKIGKFTSVQESEKKNVFVKTLNFFTYFFVQQWVLIFGKINIAIFYDSIPLFSYYCSLKPPKIIYWYHNHDMSNIELTRKYSIGWFSSKFEFEAMKSIDYFSLPSKDRLVYFPNWHKMNNFFYLPNFPRHKQFERLSLKRFDQFTIIFQGAIGPGHAIEDVLQILKLLPEINLILKGPVRKQYKDDISKIIDDYEINSQVQWIGLTSYAELIELTSKCHLGIAVHQGSDVVSKTLGTASNKIFEYLACGVPILLFDNVQFRKNLGLKPYVFYYNGEIDVLRQIILDAKQDFSKLSILARESFINNFSFDEHFNIALSKVLES